MKIYIIFLYAFVGPILISANTNDEENKYDEMMNSIVGEVQKVRYIVAKGYELVSKQITTNVRRFKSYGTLTVLIFHMPQDASDARFTFQAENIQLNSIGSCEIQDIVIDLKRGAYPAVNPDGYPFPENFIDPAMREEPLHTIEFKSGVYSYVTHKIMNPKPGNWYALIYDKWMNPLLEGIKQEGLRADCYTFLYTDLQVKKNNNMTIIDCYSRLTLDYSELPNYYKCMTTSNSDLLTLNIAVNNAQSGSERLLLSINAWNLPTKEEHLLECNFDPVVTTVQTITFIPNPNAWHYIHITKIKNSAKEYADCESYVSRVEYEGIENYTTIDLMRDNKGRFFRYDIGIPATNETDFKADATSLINLSSQTVKTLTFPLTDFHDVGGTMIIEMGLVMNKKYYAGYKRIQKQGSKYAFTEKDQFFKVVVCVSLDHTSLPLHSGKCQYNDLVTPALFVLNSTDSTSIYDKVIIPYPESGTWYMSMRLFCDDIVCPCPTSHNGTKYYIESNMVEQEEDMSGEMSNSTRPGVNKCNTSVVLSISSNKCIHARCQHEGQCLINSFNGVLMSFCQCSHGFGGWDCSDTSRLESMGILLKRVLLLTMSNLLFFCSIYVAAIRMYYTEAIMFVFTMLASTFYHACDTHIFTRLCLLEVETLRYIDFYCGNLAFWVILLAMSVLFDTLRSVLQLSGAIVISVLIMLDMQSLKTFLTPVGIGVTILLISWALDFCRKRKMKYPRSYYRKHLPFGLILVAFGLVCFAFLQTEENYYYMHSLWHIIIAGSVIFLLPDWKRGDNVNPFLPSNFSCKWAYIRNKLRLKPKPNSNVSDGSSLPNTDTNLLPTPPAAQRL